MRIAPAGEREHRDRVQQMIKNRGFPCLHGAVSFQGGFEGVSTEGSECDADKTEHGSRERGEASGTGHGNQRVDNPSKTNLPLAMRASFSLAFCLVAAPLIAADGEWSRGAEATVESKFVRRGIERAGASVAPAVWFTDEAWSLGASATVPFEKANRSEFGVNAGYTYSLEPDVKLGVEVTHFRYSNALSGHPGQTTELAASVSFSSGPGRTTLRFARDVERQADIGELSYAGEYALKAWGAFLRYRLYAGSAQADNVLPRLPAPAPHVSDSYTYHGIDLTLPYRVGGQTIVTAGVHYAGTNGARPFWSPSGAAPGPKVWLSLAASYEF